MTTHAPAPLFSAPVDPLRARRLALVLALLLASLTGCTAPTSEASSFSKISKISKTEVADLMEIQRRAWNDGDLAAFVSYYDESMTFCGGDGVTRGTKKLLARYQKSYPTAKERGVLTFKILEVRPVGDATALVLGQYILDREDPSSGFFSLLVQRTPDGVRIIHDHTSATTQQ
jgi:L-asparaginase / beta-aspartyl-peptidase